MHKFSSELDDLVCGAHLNSSHVCTLEGRLSALTAQGAFR